LYIYHFCLSAAQFISLVREVKRPADQTIITPMTRCRFVLNEKVGGQKLSVILVESCIGPK